MKFKKLFLFLCLFGLVGCGGGGSSGPSLKLNKTSISTTVENTDGFSLIATFKGSKDAEEEPQWVVVDESIVAKTGHVRVNGRSEAHFEVLKAGVTEINVSYADLSRSCTVTVTDNGGGTGGDVTTFDYDPSYEVYSENPYVRKAYGATNIDATFEWSHDTKSGTLSRAGGENCTIQMPEDDDEWLLRYEFKVAEVCEDCEFLFFANGVQIFPVPDETATYNNFNMVLDSDNEAPLLYTEEHILLAVTHLTIFADHYEADQQAASLHVIRKLPKPEAQKDTKKPPVPTGSQYYTALWKFKDYGTWSPDWAYHTDGDGHLEVSSEYIFAVEFNKDNTLTFSLWTDDDTYGVLSCASWTRPYTLTASGYEFSISKSNVQYSNNMAGMLFQYMEQYMPSGNFTGVAKPCSNGYLGGMDGIASFFRQINRNMFLDIYSSLM